MVKRKKSSRRTGLSDSTKRKWLWMSVVAVGTVVMGAWWLEHRRKTLRRTRVSSSSAAEEALPRDVAGLRALWEEGSVKAGLALVETLGRADSFYEGAEVARQVVMASRREHGDEAFLTLTAKVNLARCLGMVAAEAADPAFSIVPAAEALEALEEAFAGYDVLYGPKHQLTILVYDMLESTRSMLDDYKANAKKFASCTRDISAEFGSDVANVAKRKFKEKRRRLFQEQRRAREAASVA